MIDLLVVILATAVVLWMMYLAYDFGYESGYSDAWWHYTADAPVPERAKKKGF